VEQSEQDRRRGQEATKHQLEIIRRRNPATGAA
jgi:hypothetical protein